MATKTLKTKHTTGRRSLDRLVRRRLAETKSWRARQALGTLAIDIGEWADGLDEALDHQHWGNVVMSLNGILKDARKLRVELEKLQSPNGRVTCGDESERKN